MIDERGIVLLKYMVVALTLQDVDQIENIICSIPFFMAKEKKLLSFSILHLMPFYSHQLIIYIDSELVKYLLRLRLRQFHST